MRIGVNARFLLPGGMEGLGLYSQEVLNRMILSHPEDEFFLYFDRESSWSLPSNDNVKRRIVFPPARHPFLWYLWFEQTLPKRLESDDLDIFWSPDGFTSLAYSGKKATVIHDLGFEHYPEHVPFLVRKYYSHFSPKYAQESDHVFAVSKSTADDIMSTYGVPANKLSVAYNGVRQGFGPLTAEEKSRIQKKYSQGEDYFLFVGAMHPRKNVEGLLSAFEVYKSKFGGQEKLLITGRKAWMTSNITQVYDSMNHQADVVFLGYLDQEELMQVTGAAHACLYLSLFEGFGVPLLEAMTCGIPIICSNVSCMPEIVGDAGILVPPDQPEHIASAIHELVSQPTEWNSRAQRSLERSKAFSWDQTSDHIYTTLKQLV